MRFWKKKNDRETSFNSMEAYHKRERAILSKKFARQTIESTLQEKVYRYTYEEEATSKASQFSQDGKTKKEVLAQAYKIIRSKLSHQNPNLDRQFYTIYSDRDISYITYADRERFLQNHKDHLTQIIQKLETASQQERQKLADKEHLTRTVKNRLEQIETKQTAREKQLDKQLNAVQERTGQIKEKLAQLTEKRPTIPEPDYDRLEKMLEALRRLKNV